jgi:predicted NAD/FAD-binding protein
MAGDANFQQAQQAVMFEVELQQNCGMQDAARALGTRPTIKLSYYCNDYHPDGNFAGMIVYHTYGQHKWKQRPNQGLAGVPSAHTASNRT